MMGNLYININPDKYHLNFSVNINITSVRVLICALRMQMYCLIDTTDQVTIASPSRLPQPIKPGSKDEGSRWKDGDGVFPGLHNASFVSLSGWPTDKFRAALEISPACNATLVSGFNNST